MAVVGTGGTGSRFLKTKWPVAEGLTAGTTKLKRRSKLEPQEDLTPERERELL